MNSTVALAYGGLASVAGAIFLVVYALAGRPSAHKPELGRRGMRRQRALDAGGLFAATEPLIRFCAGWITVFPVDGARQKIDHLLSEGGDWLGASADEVFAMCALSALPSGAVGLFVSMGLELHWALGVAIVLLGLLMPIIQLTERVAQRKKRVDRGLPPAIDLAALCMGAGLDFPGSLRQVVEKSSNQSDPLVEELTFILQELELGRTRKQALENFAQRVGTEAVKDFVGAVVQAEEKGSPVAEVLRIQATMLAQRRSVRAEELAARAAVLMMGPLLLIFASITLILIGPLIITLSSAGF